MIAYIKGEVADVAENGAVIDVNGIGYRVLLNLKDIQALPAAGGTVKLHTYFSVREDAMQLFGFLRKDDLEMFRLLLGVSGIGPKAALGVLSALSADDLRFAVLADDAKTISRAPGIGNKTARKLILELKDKLSLEDAFDKRLENSMASGAEGGADDAAGEAVQALVALGYSNADALRAVKQAEVTDDMDVEAILKAALKKISFL